MTSIPIIRDAAILLGAIVAPGIVVDLMARAWMRLGNPLFSAMAPDRVPHALAIFATQIWLTAGGVTLIGLVAWDLVGKWLSVGGGE